MSYLAGTTRSRRTSVGYVVVSHRTLRVQRDRAMDPPSQRQGRVVFARVIVFLRRTRRVRSKIVSYLVGTPRSSAILSGYDARSRGIHQIRH